MPHGRWERRCAATVPAHMFHDIVRKVPIATDLVRYAVRLAAASRPKQPNAPDFVNEWISWGAGLRAGQFLVLGAKVRALLQGRAHVTIEDIQGVIETVLFSKTWTQYQNQISNGQIVIIEGKVDQSNTPPKILVDSIKTEIKILFPFVRTSN